MGGLGLFANSRTRNTQSKASCTKDSNGRRLSISGSSVFDVARFEKREIWGRTKDREKIHEGLKPELGNEPRQPCSEHSTRRF